MSNNSQEVVAEKFKMSDLLKKEDWWAIWLGFTVLLFSMISHTTKAFNFKAWNSQKNWGTEKLPTVFDALKGVFPGIFITLLVIGVLFGIGLIIMKKDFAGYLKAFPVIFLLTAVAYLIAHQHTMNLYLGYAFWCLFIGLLISNTVGTPTWLMPAVKTEYYIKTGLVVFGAEVLFSNIAKFGIYGLGVAWLVTPVVVIFMWLYGTKFLKMTSKSMVMVIACATSVCGVSAAIAAAAASKAKKDDLTFAIGLSLIFTVIMMIVMPFAIKAMGLDPMVGGAWIGGTIDSTGAVVLAGEALGPVGAQTAAMVKMIQNVLIGVLAFAIAVFWVTSVEKVEGSPSVGISEVWHRFPKFILGFILASIVFSFLVEPAIGADATKKILKISGSYRGWFFALAFMCIGLESNFKEMADLVQGGKPLNLYIVGQTFNLVLTLLIAWLLLSGVIFPIPNLTV